MDILAVAAGAAGGAVVLTAETEGTGGLTINLFWVIVSAINFLILFALVWPFAFKPLHIFPLDLLHPLLFGSSLLIDG